MRRISVPTIKIGQSGIVNPFDLIGSRDLAYEILGCLTKKDFGEPIPKEHGTMKQGFFPSHILNPEACRVLANLFAIEYPEKLVKEEKNWLKNAKENIIRKLQRVPNWKKKWIQ